MLEPTIFSGLVTQADRSLQVTFTASVDTTGALGLAFETQPRSRETAILHDAGSARRANYLHLEGEAEDGAIFRSNTFHVTRFSAREGQGVSLVEFKGSCQQAEVVRRLAEPTAFHQLVWFFRQLSGYGWQSQETDLGRVFFGASPPGSGELQQLTGSIGLQGQGPASERWFEQGDEALAHIARVMSFACGVLLRPHVERRVDGALDTLKITSHTDTPEPFLAPFVFLNQEPIFAHACAMDVGARERFKKLDSAVSWLLAPGFYDEIRLITAITALENLVDDAANDGAALLAAGKNWKRFASAVRLLIDDHQMPDAMKKKVPELQRRTFIDKLDALLDGRGVAREDISHDAISAMVNARNLIAHKGVYFDPSGTDQVDLWEHLLLARELATRILLNALDFRGNYFAPLYSPNQQRRFPSCRPLSDAEGCEISELPLEPDRVVR
jgi:hypothetical protein